MANIFTNLNLTADSNFFITQKINSIGYVGENTVTRLNIKVPEITDGATYELETENSAGEKNVALLSTDAENNTLYLDFTANMLTVNDLIMMQLRVTYTDNSIKKSNRFAMKIAKSISATDYYEEYAVTIFDQLVNECRDTIEGAESYAIRAETAAVNAEAYEQSASASAEAASASEATATSASVTAVNAKTSAESASAAAHTSAETATTAANSASTSASTAQTSAQTATNASEAATTASETAVNASTTATSAATSAESSASSATTAANNASASATSAASSASNASNSATSATTAASNAATSETNAASSAASASTSAANANTSATNAANSATSAATSATNAHNSEVNASTSETNANTSATEAAASAESIAASVAQINENTYRINDLEAIIAGYQLADLPTGAVASVTDGTALLMPSLKIGIEPAQDLHGYDHPWAGGAGKNKFDIEGWLNSSGATYTKSGNTYTISAASTLYGTPFTFSDTDVAVSVSASSYVAGTATNIRMQLLSRNNNLVGELTANQSYQKREGLVASKVRLNWTAIGTFTITEPQIELGSTATTFTPYSNICPISGRTAANVNVSPTTSAEDGTTYTIEFRDGDNPLTVYGGTLDVTSGELVVDRAMYTATGTETWSVVGSGEQLRVFIVFPSKGTSAICNIYKTGNAENVGEFDCGGTYLRFNISGIATDAASFNTWIQGLSDGLKVIYKLAEPITYHLTPTQVRTLVGDNNIWTDTGDIISGKYFRSLV